MGNHFQIWKTDCWKTYRAWRKYCVTQRAAAHVLLPGSFLCFDRRSRRQLISLLSVITFQKRECSRNWSSDDAMNKGNFLYILIMHETRHVRTQSNIGWSSKNSKLSSDDASHILSLIFRVFVEVWCLKYSLVYLLRVIVCYWTISLGETEC